MKKITIIGGGISGLVARYRLSQVPDVEVTLYEKSERLGGCIESLQDPYFFEMGPRTIKASRSEDLLKLIQQLDLETEIIYSSKHAKKRYLWVDQKLQAIPSLLPPLLPALFNEWRRPALIDSDESIASFAKRRFGTYGAETFFDPLTRGIFGGDMNTLSISACFPELKALEQTYGSLTRALIKKKREKKPKGLFTLKGGLQTLVDRLVKRGKGKIHLSTPIEALPEGETVIALPVREGAKLFQDDQKALSFFKSVPTISLTVVNVAFKGETLVPQGFGYLVPSKERENILGVVFDSSIFPMQNREKETRLTVMLRDGGEREALFALKKHLSICKIPDRVHVKTYPYAVPQYCVGHLERVEAFEAHLKEHYPHITCIGNYLRGVSLNACVKSL
ncbi:MAG: protoporphyrinogen oxidase [Chlamydiia bacterium]|nr:protoporphyrinogen oxidase [Chlamydiia bacterium]